jgi:Phage major capsid protein E
MAYTEYIYPTSSEITEIGRELQEELTMNDPLFDIMPVREVNSHILEWEQQDNFRGLQQFRGLDGDPPRVTPMGAKRLIVEPGVYGEYMRINEREITTRRKYGTFGSVIDLEDLVMEKTENLLHRRIKRLKYVGWQVIVYGRYTILAPNGAVAHRDAFANQTYAAATPWSDQSNSTPLQDLRNMQLLSLGKSINFGAQAKIYMNRVTANYLLNNTNQQDLGGKRMTGLTSILSMKQINEILTNEDLPNIVIYEGGYEDDNGTFQRYIPTGRIAVVGERMDNADIMEYRMTINANNPSEAPGAYMKVVDTLDREVPRKIDVHDGHNGGPVIYYPSAIISGVV